MSQIGNKELQANVKTIQKLEQSWIRKPNITASEAKTGLDISRLATAHPEEVAMTPIMKNMLQAFGDIGEHDRLLTDSPATRAEKWLTDTCKALLLEQSKTVHDGYDVRLPMRSVDHYYTDCWLNLDPKKWRDIQPGQVQEINEMILQNYARPTVAIDTASMLDLKPAFGKAVEVVMDELPRVSATHKIVEVNLPFMTKHTNVGYKWFRNDRTRVPGSNQSYAQMTMDLADKLKNTPKSLNEWNVTTEFARFQRGKGRLIQAVSRIVNLVLNQLEAVEIADYKARSPLFAGYNDATYLKNVLVEMLRACEQQHNVMYNIDYHRYDAHVTRGMLELLGAVSMAKCADARSRDMAAYRAALMSKTWLVAGTLNRIVEVYGRIFSGFIDTNRGGGIINAIAATYLVMMQDPHYVRDIVGNNRYRMLVMGDDNLVIVNPDSFSLPRLQKDALYLNFEIDDASKIAFGPKFLQYRVFEWNNQLVMAYPWTRVLRSMLFKERSSGLGPCGWTLAFYQQLAKLIEVPEFLAPVVNIVAYFDGNHLMLDRSVDDIIQGAVREDAEASQGDSRFESTARRLYDGDPSKAEQFSADGEKLEANYFTKVQGVIKSVYSPTWLANHGIHAPSIK